MPLWQKLIIARPEVNFLLDLILKHSISGTATKIVLFWSVTLIASCAYFGLTNATQFCNFESTKVKNFQALVVGPSVLNTI